MMFVKMTVIAVTLFLFSEASPEDRRALWFALALLLFSQEAVLLYLLQRPPAVELLIGSFQQPCFIRPAWDECPLLSKSFIIF